MTVSFNGFNESVLTFKTIAKIESGTFVKMSGNGTVAACESGDEIIGVVISGDENHAAVQVGGVVTAPVASGVTGLTPGFNILTANGKNILLDDDSCVINRLVLSVDTNKITFIL